MFWDWFEQCPFRQNDDGVRVKLNCEQMEDRCNPADITGWQMFVNTPNEDIVAGDKTVSLREAVEWSNTHPPGAGNRNLIEFASGLKGKTILLKNADLDIQEPTRILGLGSTALTVSRDATTGSFRLFHVQAGGSLAIEKLKLTGGEVAAKGYGGAILSDGTSLTVTQCEIKGNAVLSDASTGLSAGGGIYASAGTVTINGFSTVSGNSADRGGGVAVASSVTLNITESAIATNTATRKGGGVYADGGPVTIDKSQVAANTAADGGGVYATGATVLTLKGGTEIKDNEATGYGGGVYIGGQKIVYSGVTIGDNKAPVGQGDGVYRYKAARDGDDKTGVKWVLGDAELFVQ